MANLFQREFTPTFVGPHHTDPPHVRDAIDGTRKDVGDGLAVWESEGRRIIVRIYQNGETYHKCQSNPLWPVKLMKDTRVEPAVRTLAREYTLSGKSKPAERTVHDARSRTLDLTPSESNFLGEYQLPALNRFKKIRRGSYGSRFHTRRAISGGWDRAWSRRIRRDRVMTSGRLILIHDCNLPEGQSWKRHQRSAKLIASIMHVANVTGVEVVPIALKSLYGVGSWRGTEQNVDVIAIHRLNRANLFSDVSGLGAISLTYSMPSLMYEFGYGTNSYYGFPSPFDCNWKQGRFPRTSLECSLGEWLQPFIGSEIDRITGGDPVLIVPTLVSDSAARDWLRQTLE